MNAPPPRGFRGAVVWAFTSLQPEAPFELVAGDGVTRSYPTAAAVAAAIRNRELDAIPTFHVPAKLRPVVLLQDRPRGRLPEYAALKLARLNKLSPADQERVRNGEMPALFHLAENPSRYGLKQDNAVDLNSLVRVHRSAIATSPVGYLDTTEIGILGRRLAKFLDIDLGPDIQAGVNERWDAVVAAQSARRKPR